MKFFVSSEQATYYKENLSIEFDQLVLPEEVEELNEWIGDIMSKRLRFFKSDVWNKPSKELFSVGYDLWRENPEILKIEKNRRFLEIAAQLFGHKPFRMGYDHFLPSYKEEIMSDPSNDYKNFIQNQLPFNELTCIQGVIGGMILCIKEGSEEGFLPTKPGNVVFFSPTAHLDLKGIESSGSYLLITYIKSNAIFIKNNLDPLFLPLKKLGYTIGDRIKDETHPLICR